MLNKKFRVEPYGRDVWVVIDTEEATRLAAVKCGVFLNDGDFFANGMTIHGNGNNIVWLPDQVRYSTLAHECGHVALNIFYTAGATVDTSNQEPFTYLLGYIFGEVIKAHDKLRGLK